MRCQSWTPTGRAGRYVQPCQHCAYVMDVRTPDVSPTHSGRPQVAQNLAPVFTGAPHPGQNFGVFAGAGVAGVFLSCDAMRGETVCFDFTNAPAASACR